MIITSGSEFNQYHQDSLTKASRPQTDKRSRKGHDVPPDMPISSPSKSVDPLGYSAEYPPVSAPPPDSASSGLKAGVQGNPQDKVSYPATDVYALNTTANNACTPNTGMTSVNVSMDDYTPLTNDSTGFNDITKISLAEINSMIDTIKVLIDRQIKSDSAYSDLLTSYDDLDESYGLVCQKLKEIEENGKKERETEKAKSEPRRANPIDEADTQQTRHYKQETRRDRGTGNTTGETESYREKYQIAIEEISILKERLADAYTRIDRYEEEKTRSFYHQKHLASVFRNPDLSGNEKLTGIAMLEEIRSLKEDPHERTELCMQTIADRVGISTSTLNRINKKLDTLGGWEYKVGETTVVNGEYNTPISITMQKFVDAPSQIKRDPSQKQGGAREKRCKGCGSDDLDIHTMQYCRSCKRVHIEAQAGIRSDANVYDALTSIAAGNVSVSEFLEVYACQAEKQDAFDSLDQIDQADSTAIDQALPVDQAPEKQDAFDLEAIAPICDQGIDQVPEKQDAFEPDKCNMRDNDTYKKLPRKLVIIPAESKPTIDCYFCHVDAWRYSQHEQVWMCSECYSPINSTLHNLKVENKW